MKKCFVLTYLKNLSSFRYLVIVGEQEAKAKYKEMVEDPEIFTVIINEAVMQEPEPRRTDWASHIACDC